ncbi:MAG: HAMP domain-containing protein [Planctomycetes bacterium]|nr:HAMP domain-containing protein [Planctomycetota bacterium]
MKNHRTEDRPEVMAALSGKNGSDERRSETMGVPFRYMAQPLIHNGQVVAAVRLAVPVKTIAESESLLRNAVLWSILAGTIAAVLLGLLTSWIWYAPLRRITKAARQIASGDLSSGARLAGSNRLSELAVALNDMRDNLGKYLGQIAAQHQDFQAVLVNLKEGVIATDANGQIILMNQAVGKLLSVEMTDVVGKHIQSVLPAIEILEFFNRTAASQTPIRDQLEITTPAGRRTIEIHGAKITGSMNITCLLVMRDVTDLATSSAMKAQFVANASHELRTPLATIRAAVDSLASVESGNNEELTKLTGILDRHVGRLEDMTKDLLDLHMVESAKFSLRLQDIALGDLAEWTQAQFAAQTQEKGLTLAVSTSRPEHQIRSDRKLLEMILRNLIDNAIKFTPSGGGVECTFDISDQGTTLRVSDTGCGIKPTDQQRVFERFFQGDAARSGDSRNRGTGLGLAIVKHAADRLGAKIDLRSEMGHGTTIMVFLS